MSSTGILAHTFNIGTGELMVILLVGLLVFGPKKLPEVARKVGKSFQLMRKTVNAFRDEVRDAIAVPAEEVGIDKDEATKDTASEDKSETGTAQDSTAQDGDGRAQDATAQDATAQDNREPAEKAKA